MTVRSRLWDAAFRGAKSVPPVRRRLEAKYEDLLRDLKADLKPYRGDLPTYSRLPAEGVERREIIENIKSMGDREKASWQEGYASGAVYHGGQEHIDFLNEVYALNSQSNPLHPDLWPSVAKYETEVVAMTAQMLGGEGRAMSAEREVCGAVASGGTESILLAMKAYRDQAGGLRAFRRGNPEVVAPVTAHAAFDKAAHYFGIKLIRVPVNEGYRADPAAMREAISRRTVAIVGSAPTFPHGVIDPIPALAAVAGEKGVGLHVDACLGGFILPWAQQLGYNVPVFDFRLPEVTSMSVDTHKYGYAAKGTSVVLYRGKSLRRWQYFRATDWPGGLYASPTLAGSRPGALSAACWAALVSMGEEGYREAAGRILETGSRIRSGIQGIEGLRVLGDPLWVIAFSSDELDIYRVLDGMSSRNWSLNGLHYPASIHLCVTLRHTLPGVVARFLEDLRSSVREVRENPTEKGGMAPVYGTAARIPVRGAVGDLLERYLDSLYEL